VIDGDAQEILIQRIFTVVRCFGGGGGYDAVPPVRGCGGNHGLRRREIY
jgi:hypothetical protein